ncbi:hypothetical protein ACFY00_37900 [Kitasatospora sp. NPDC001540]|uniref:hypothetical protein n=1 Tax=Kitasatospora sp. NPDC001540 TaxID=3364014 RepID=UPI0036C30A4E
MISETGQPTSRADAEAAVLRAAAADPRLRHGAPDRIDDLAVTFGDGWALGTWSDPAAADVQLLLHQDAPVGWAVLLPKGSWGREDRGGYAAVLYRSDRPEEGELVLGDLGRPRVSGHVHEALEHIRWAQAARTDRSTATTSTVSPGQRPGSRLRGLVDQRLAQQAQSSPTVPAAVLPQPEMAVPRHPLTRGAPATPEVRRQLPLQHFGDWWRLEGWLAHPDVWLVTDEGREVGWVERDLPGLTGRWVAVYDQCFVVDAATEDVLHFDTPEDAAYIVQQAYLQQV